jgi:AcrR family transcriptional regulator
VTPAPRSAKQQTRSGPYRNSVSHESIVSATWDLLEEVGYHDLTIEGVAGRAGVGKATIYRWWPSKGALVAEAISTHLDHSPRPPSGDVRRDLRDSIQVSIDNYSSTVAGMAIPAMLADLSFETDSYEAFRQSFLAPRRRSSAEVVQRAIDAGLLPEGTDVGLLQDVWAGAIFYRVLISREPVSPDLADSLTSLILCEPPKVKTPKGRAAPSS